jgi:hypothetical protein
MAGVKFEVAATYSPRTSDFIADFFMKSALLIVMFVSVFTLITDCLCLWTCFVIVIVPLAISFKLVIPYYEPTFVGIIYKWGFNWQRSICVLHDRYVTWRGSPFFPINVREYQRGNQNWIIQRNWQYRVLHKMQTNKTKTQHNMRRTPLHSNKHKQLK